MGMPHMVGYGFPKMPLTKPETKPVLGTNNLGFQRGLFLTVMLLAHESEPYLFLAIFHSKIVHVNMKPVPYK